MRYRSRALMREGSHTIVINTSVFAVMLLQEPEAEPFALAIARYPGRLVCAFTALGIAIVIGIEKK